MTEEPRTLWVETNDGPLRVVHDGTGPNVVLLHPGGLDLTVWDELATSLTRTHHVVRFDARSHGKSATAHTDHRPVADLLTVLDALKIPSAHLIGCSMGGVTATEATVCAPERVQSLGLLGGEVWPHKHDQDPFFAQCETEMAAAIQDGNAPRWVNAMVRLSVDGPRRHASQVNPVVRARVQGLIEQAVRDHVTATGQQLWHSVRHRLAEITVPTLALVGQLDSDPVHHTAALIEREVPGARWASIPDAGHMLMLEAPRQTLTEVLTHLTQRPR